MSYDIGKLADQIEQQGETGRTLRLLVLYETLRREIGTEDARTAWSLACAEFDQRHNPEATS